LVFVLLKVSDRLLGWWVTLYFHKGSVAVKEVLEKKDELYTRSYLTRRESKPDDSALDHMTIDHLFADVWSRTNLPMRERNIIIVALLAALGRNRELERHIEGALHLGIRCDTIIEVMLQVAYYAVWPAGYIVRRIARELFACRAGAPVR
jgi:4-carboxymuconolactone decarboxylase